MKLNRNKMNYYWIYKQNENCALLMHTITISIQYHILVLLQQNKIIAVEFNLLCLDNFGLGQDKGREDT